MTSENDNHQHFLEVPHQRFNPHVYHGTGDLGSSVYGTFATHLKDYLGELFVRDDFSADHLTEQFVDETKRFAPSALPVILNREEAYKTLGDGPVTQKLAELAIGDPQITLVLDPTFVDDICNQLTDPNLDDDFSELQEYHEELGRTKVLELWQTIQQLSVSGSTDWVNQAFDAVKEATEHPDLYSAPLDLPESMYALCFVTDPVRQLSRRMVVGNTALVLTKELLGKKMDADDQEIFDLIHRYLAIDALTGQQWDELIHRSYGGEVSEDRRLEMSTMLAENQDILEKIQEMVKSGRGTNVVDAFRNAQLRLRDVTDMEAETDPIKEWRQIDHGHAFDGFRLYALDEAFRHDKDIEYKPDKTRGYAAVLEDDQRQMSLWRKTIDKRSPFVTNDDLCSADPETIAATGSNPEVRYFLLDIQNGDDKTAGIRIGQRILEERLKIAEGEKNDEEFKEDKDEYNPTRIIIWSSSGDALRQAEEHFEEFIAKLTDEQRKLISAKDIQVYGFNAPISLGFKLKGLNQYSFSPMFY